ncbi:MAG TPA: sugar ABC transporter ATP-binding protein [Chitinophagaceae bacterium]|nr:sugar ABC transporter ATP-binding protein [Chitinophagaceae bacterium]
MLLQLQHINKTYPGVNALKDVSLTIAGGEVHALCGENGAGKSTLMNILSGNQQPTSGEILLNNKSVKITNPLRATALGIAIVHQEKSLSESLSIAENIYAGRQPVNKWGLINYSLLYQKTTGLLERLGLQYLSPRTILKQISSAEQQMVEVAKALSLNPRILILDEPTAAITEKETEILFHIISQLKKDDVAIVYISHRMREIFSISDKVSVLKDGNHQGTRLTAETNTNDLIKMMVGREIPQLPVNKSRQATTALKVQSLCGDGFHGISFSIHKGEVVGLSGLVGAGRSEIAKAIFGAAPVHSGDIFIHDKKVNIQSTGKAIKLGIGYIAEERKTEGTFPDMNVGDNIVAANMKAAKTKNLFSNEMVSSIAEKFIKKLNIATPNVKRQVRFLSGGNQQKVVIAKWLLADTEILIADEPTRGVDVGSRFEIYQLLKKEAEKGKAILLISSELPELLLLSDTIHVIRNGKLVETFNRENATEEKIMLAAAAE